MKYKSSDGVGNGTIAFRLKKVLIRMLCKEHNQRPMSRWRNILTSEQSTLCVAHRTRYAFANTH